MSLRDELKKTALEEQRRQEIAREEEQKRDHDKELADKIFDDLVKVISEKAQKGELSVEGLLTCGSSWRIENVNPDIYKSYDSKCYDSFLDYQKDYVSDYYLRQEYPFEIKYREKSERTLSFLKQRFEKEGVSCTASISKSYFLVKKLDSFANQIPDYYKVSILVFIKLSWA